MPLSQPHVDAVCNFFERILKHTQDEWYGKPFLLAPWQEECLSQIFGQVDEDGRRIIETAYLEVPKKAGKSEMVAGIVLYTLMMDPNPGCQVWGAASATKQALNVFRAACKMVEQSPILKECLLLRRGTNRILKQSDKDSFYAAVAGDGDIGDGVNPSFFVADEVHRWRTRKQLENWDVLSNGGITRRQTLTVAITTAGVQDESPLAWRLHEKARKIEQGIVTDPKFFGRIYSADPEDDPGSPETWIKANPSLKENGGFLDISKIREKYESFVAEGDLTAFKRYYLSLWDQKENQAISMNDWDACDGETHGLVDRVCYAGLDLSSTIDLTAMVLDFPSDEDDTHDILPFFWMPEAKVRERERRDGVPYSRWIRDGFITATEGDVIDYELVKQKLRWARECFELREVAYDPWNATQLSLQLIDEGFKCVPTRQGYQSMSAPTKKLLELTIAHKFRHAAHPVLRWNASCLSTKSDGNDNVRPVKPERRTSSKRIDGMVALIMALDRAMRNEEGLIEYTGLRSVG